MERGGGTTTRRAALLALCCLALGCAPSSGGSGPDPVITSFSASPASIAAGGSASLTAVFSGGTGTVDHGIGAVTSGVPVGTGPLSATTTYTLTVTGAGGPATAQTTVTVTAQPPSATIDSFTASPASVTAGSASSLTAVFSGGTGVIEPGIGPVTSGVPVGTGPLSATTVYTLTVTGTSGSPATAQTTVTVVQPPPSIASFSASPASITAGGASSLTAVFSGGTGVVEPGIGPVTSGVSVGTGPLSATTTYTLTVTGAGGSATAQTTVTVSLPTVITFTTEGASFAPVIVVEGTPTILWTFHDGTTSSSPTPSKSYGSSATRHTTLHVTPWSAVRRINLGYDAGDGGSTAIELVADQHVSAVQGLRLVAPSLVEWCSSGNLITSLDFSDFTQLETIEAYQSTSLATVTLRNTPRLSRACFEQCGLTALDVSESPLLADLRGALNAFPTIAFGAGTFPQAWHVCTRDIPLTDRTLFASSARFPNIRDLWIWNDNQAGTLRVPSTGATGRVDLRLEANAYTALDLSGALQNPAEVGFVKADANQLTSVDLDGCVQISELYLQNNLLGEAAVDGILATLDSLGRTWTPGLTLVVDLRGNSAPGAAGRASAASLAAKGWTVHTDG